MLIVKAFTIIQAGAVAGADAQGRLLEGAGEPLGDPQGRRQDVMLCDIMSV